MADLESFKRGLGHTGKMIVVGVLVFLCWLGSLLVWGVISEREGRQAEAEREVAELWGRPQLIAGPVIVVPFTKVVTSLNTQPQVVRQNLYILPTTLKIDASLQPEVRSRGIFNAPVYHTSLGFKGTFKRPDLASLGLAPGALLWNEAVLAVGLSDTRGINLDPGARLGNRELKFAPGAALWNVNGMGIHASLPESLRGEQEFIFALSLTGSKGLSFLPLGEGTSVRIMSSWNSPSFVGTYLPRVENITSDGFDAIWDISALGRSYPDVWVGSMQDYEPAISSSAFGVNLFREVTFYTLVSRTVKYAILFIALTFLAFYLFEVTSLTRVHPFQYLLIGAALVLFYLLLLSFAEHIGFGRAYLLSAIMTLGLVTTYSATVLKASRRAWIVALILAILYAYLYAILQLEQYALLFGTLFLFAALAAVMRATRGIQWYDQVPKS